MEIRHFNAEAKCFIVAMKPFVVVRTRIEWGNEERGYFTKAFKDSIKSAVVEGLLSEQKSLTNSSRNFRISVCIAINY